MDLSYKTIDAIRARHVNSDFPYARQTGNLQALVARLAVEIDVNGDEKLKRKIEQILLGYQAQ
jgi:hypothetical protein